MAVFYEPVSNKFPTSFLKLISTHAFLQCLDVFGARRLSLIDDTKRDIAEEGRYMRWSYVHLRLCGYDEDEPEFVVFSTLSGTKHAGRKGDNQFQDFAVGTRKPNDELGSHRDLALGFIALAVLQGSMGPTLLQVIQEPSFGKQLLRTSSNGFHQFDCLKQFEDAAVFVDQRTEAFQVKHHSDKHPLGPLIHPLTTGSTALILERCGRAVGFNEKLNYSALRTTHSIKAQMFTRRPFSNIQSF